MTTQEKLARIKNRHTAYELALIKGEERILVGYSVSRSRGTLSRMVSKHGPAIVTLPGAEDKITFAKKASEGAVIGEWLVKYTGRTQHEAICAGELAWIGEKKFAVAA